MANSYCNWEDCEFQANFFYHAECCSQSRFVKDACCFSFRPEVAFGITAAIGIVIGMVVLLIYRAISFRAWSNALSSTSQSSYQSTGHGVPYYTPPQIPVGSDGLPPYPKQASAPPPPYEDVSGEYQRSPPSAPPPPYPN